jgi:hypothetical protein
VAEATPWPLGGGSATPKGQIFFFLKKGFGPWGWLGHPSGRSGVAEPPPRAKSFFFLLNNKIMINGLSPQHLWKKYELLIANKHFSYKKGLKILFSELELLKYNFFQKLKL